LQVPINLDRLSVCAEVKREVVVIEGSITTMDGPMMIGANEHQVVNSVIPASTQPLNVMSFA
jgi:hypothetical protein